MREDDLSDIRDITAWLYEVSEDMTTEQIHELREWLVEIQSAYVFGDGMGEPPDNGFLN